MPTSLPQEPFSVLIPDGESAFALFVAHCFSYFPNVKIHVLSRKRWSPIRFSRYCHSYTFEQTTDDATRLDIIRQLARKYRIDVFLPTDIPDIYFAIANRESLKEMMALSPLPDAAAFEVANNKWLLSQFLDGHRIPGPPTVLVDYSNEFESRLRDLSPPILLKPVTSRDGHGIKQFETRLDFMHFLDQQHPEGIKGKYIAQSLLSGSDLDLNFLSRAGEILASTIQTAIIPNAKKYAAAGAIQFIKNDRFSEVAVKLVAGLGWSGYANVDTIYTKDGSLRIVDINARFWGSVRGSLIAGVSFPYLACLAALNIPFPKPDYSEVRYFHPKTAIRERVAAITGREQEKIFPSASWGWNSFGTILSERLYGFMSRNYRAENAIQHCPAEFCIAE